MAGLFAVLCVIISYNYYDMYKVKSYNYDYYEKKISENLFEFSARLEIEYLNKMHNLDLPESESYDTLGGLIVFNKEEIPDLINSVKHFDDTHPLHIQMMSRLNEILQEDNSNVLIFKNPHDYREKEFHLNLINSERYILTDYSDQFCKLEIKKDKQKITDQTCIEDN